MREWEREKKERKNEIDRERGERERKQRGDSRDNKIIGKRKERKGE